MRGLSRVLSWLARLEALPLPEPEPDEEDAEVETFGAPLTPASKAAFDLLITTINERMASNGGVNDAVCSELSQRAMEILAFGAGTLPDCWSADPLAGLDDDEPPVPNGLRELSS
jgi:hypothetical protein